jgi:hypothetical protein
VATAEAPGLNEQFVEKDYYVTAERLLGKYTTLRTIRRIVGVDEVVS